MEDLGAYVTLLEFGEIEGMVPLSELSRRRIRCRILAISTFRFCSEPLAGPSASSSALAEWKSFLLFAWMTKVVPNLKFIIDGCNTVTAGYIDLSKKRVSSEEKSQQSDRYEKAKSVHSIIYSVGAHTGVPVETLYENIGWPLYVAFVT